jgi:hypothetical protein
LDLVADGKGERPTDRQKKCRKVHEELEKECEEGEEEVGEILALRHKNRLILIRLP